jgi:hypothetical protein
MVTCSVIASQGCSIFLLFPSNIVRSINRSLVLPFHHSVIQRFWNHHHHHHHHNHHHYIFLSQKSKNSFNMLSSTNFAGGGCVPPKMYAFPKTVSASRRPFFVKIKKSSVFEHPKSKIGEGVEV